MPREAGGGRAGPEKQRAPARARAAIKFQDDQDTIARRGPGRETEVLERARVEEEILLHAAECVRLARRRALDIHDFVRVDAGIYQCMGALLQQLAAAEQRAESREVDVWADAIDRLEQVQP